MTGRFKNGCRHLVLVSAAVLVFFWAIGFEFSAHTGRIGELIKPAMSWGEAYLGGIKMSKLSAELCLTQNISGLKPDLRLPSPFDQAVFFTGLLLDEPLQMVSANLRPLMAITEPVSISSVDSAPTNPEELDEPVSVEKDVTIAVYCTHNGETFLPDSKTSRFDHQSGLINEVAEVLAQELSKRGLKAIHDDTIHDDPDYNMSYARSHETVARLLQDNPDIAVMFDIHRDAMTSSKTPLLAEINGRKAAQILIIVGSDQRKPNPNWSENLAFANEIRQMGEMLYPGLIKGVRVKPGTYNQELLQPSLLVEFGNQYNSLEQAKYSAALFAEIVDQVLSEGESTH